MTPNGVTYDAGALIAAEKGEPHMWSLHRRALARGRRPTVATTVLAQVWRGGPQAKLSRLLAGCNIEPVTETNARSAGAALAASGTSDVIDALVVIGATTRGDAIVTSDPDDLQIIADASRRTITLIEI